MSMNHIWEWVGVLVIMAVWGGMAMLLLLPYLKRPFARLTFHARHTPFRTLLGVVAVGIAMAYAQKPIVEDPKFVCDSNIDGSITIKGVENIAKLTTLTIPATYAGSNVTMIAEGFCQGCTNIAYVSIPHSVVSIGDKFFARNGLGGAGLKTISVASSNEYYAVQNGLLYQKNEGRLVACAGQTVSIDVPTNIVEIGAEALAGCDALTNVVLWSTGAVELGTRAFAQCNNLKCVYYCGDCPTVKGGATIYDGSAAVTSYVRKPQYVSGWGDVPGIWQDRPLKYGGASFKVTYSSNKGSSRKYAAKIYDEDLTLAGKLFEYSGYDMLGWTTNAATTNIDYALGATYTNNAAITLYAVWKTLPKPTTWTAIFDTMGAEGTFGPFEYPVDEVVTLPACTLQKDGYVFAGWAKKPNGEAYADNLIMVTSGGTKVTVYAVWLKPGCYGIAFNPAVTSASWTMDYQSIGLGKVAKLNACALTPPAGKRFAGWTCNKRRYDDGIMVFNLASKTNEVITMTAIWESETK